MIDQVDGLALGLAWSPDGESLALVWTESAESETGLLRIVDVGSATITERGEADVVSVPVWSPDGARVATAGVAGNIELVDVATGEREVLSTVGVPTDWR